MRQLTPIYWFARLFSLLVGVVLMSGAFAESALASTEDVSGDANGETVVRIPDVRVTKTGPTQVPADKPFTYTLTVSNLGTSAAPNVVIVDELSDLLVHTGSTVVETGEVCTEEDLNGNRFLDISCPIGTLEAGDRKTISINVQAATPSAGMVDNTAVAWANGNPIFTSNTFTTELLPANSPVLEGSYEGPASVAIGEEFDYTLVVSNTGTGSASNVNIRSNIPTTLTFVSATVTGGGACAYGVDFDEDGVDEVLCNFGTLVADAQETATIRVKAAAAGLAEMVATLGLFGGQDRVPSNTITTQIEEASGPSLTLEKVGPATVKLNDAFTYTLVVKNSGTSAVTNVALRDAINPALEMQGTPSTTAGTCTVTTSSPLSGSGSEVNCNLGTVAPGRSDTVRVSVRASRAAGAVTNTFTVTADGITSQQSNTVETEVQLLTSTLSLLKEGPSVVRVGGEMAYTLLIVNTSDVRVHDVTFTDQLSSTFRLRLPGVIVASNASIQPCPHTLSNNHELACNIGSIPPRDTARVTISGVFNAPGMVENSFTARAEAMTASAESNTIVTDVKVPSLLLGKQGPAVAGVGVDYTYTLTVVNTGSVIADNVVVRDLLSNLIRFKSSSTAGCEAKDLNGDGEEFKDLECTFEQVAPGERVTITFLVTATQAGTVENVATATAGFSDVVPEVVSNTVTTAIREPATLSITKEGPATTNPDSTIAYQFKVKNTGSQDAFDVVVVDPLFPNALAFVSGTDCAVAPTPEVSVVTCAVGNIAAGQEKTVMFVARVQAAKGNQVENSALARATNAAEVESNTVSTEVQGAPGTVRVAVSDTVVPAGGTVSTTLTPGGTEATTCYVQAPNQPTVATGNATIRSVQPGETLPSGLEDLGAALNQLYKVDIPPGGEQVRLDDISGIPGLFPLRTACGSSDTSFEKKLVFVGVLDDTQRLVLDWSDEVLRLQLDAAEHISTMVSGNTGQGDAPLNMVFRGGPNPVMLSSGFVFNQAVQVQGEGTSSEGRAVTFDGSTCQSNCTGFTFRGGNSSLRNLRVRRYAGEAVVIEGHSHSHIQNNDLSNNGAGVRIRNSDNNHVGGSTGAGNTVSAKQSVDKGLQRSGYHIGRLVEGGNVISNNGGPGVWVESGVGNTILGNQFVANTGLAIDLGVEGWSTNDSQDGDEGANQAQNYPVLEQVIEGAQTTIEGRLESTPSSSYTLAFYASPACHASGSGEGAQFLGLGTATTEADGVAAFTITVDGVVDTGHVVTATATSAEGNTSEFSACLGITSGVATEADVLPASFVLHQNYPNPFNPTTTITFDLPTNTHVMVTVYDVLGQAIRTLADRPMTAGQHRVVFDASGLSSGLYVYQVTLPNTQQMKHMVLLK